MRGPIHRKGIPWDILKHGSRFWDRVGDIKLLTKTPLAQPTFRRKKRFVIQEGIVSSAGIRLALGKRRIGVMFLNFRKYQHFDAKKKRLIKVFANQVAISIEIARLSRQIKKSGLLEAANYFATELHDAVGENLTWGVRTPAGIAKDHLNSGAYDEVRRQLRIIERFAINCQDECGAIVRLMKTHKVYKLGLVRLLKRSCAAWRLRGVKVDLQIPHEKPLPVTHELPLYRIVQIAMSNVIKYARAHQVKIRLDISKNRVRLSISDDGVGFNRQTALHDKMAFGLRNIRDRARIIGGKVKIYSQLGEGTSVVVTIPNG